MEAAVNRPAASVFTLSHNKGGFAVQAIQSVLGQDFTDFEYWIIENSTDTRTRGGIAPLLDDERVIYEETELTAEERGGCYVPAMLLNRYYPKANGDVIFYLSDDDLWDPRLMSRAMTVLQDPDRHVAWWTMQLAEEYGAGPVPCGMIPATHEAGAGTTFWNVDCRIDGGQIAHRKACLDKIGQPWFPETAEPSQARHADGLFLQKLAGWFTFYPVAEPDVPMLTHRRTPLSTWDKV